MIYSRPREHGSQGGGVAQDPNARLVYSTGGETDDKEEKAGSSRSKRGGSGRVGRSHARPMVQGAANRAGSSPGIRLRLERRASDRLVTCISGLPGRPAEVADLARALKSACGAGGTVKSGVVELQGDHRDAVEAFLLVRGLKSKRAGG
jgi:predicted translation initiation factor SUI1